MPPARSSTATHTATAAIKESLTAKMANLAERGSISSLENDNIGFLTSATKIASREATREQNSVRPHMMSLAHLTPIEFKQQHSVVSVYHPGATFQE
jgi:hypothetical protein